MKRRLRVLKAEGCAWRARYLYFGDKQLARIGVDPADGVKPILFGAAPVGWYRSCAGLIYPRLLDLRIPLPHVPWRTNASRLERWAYRASSRFWLRVDGRWSYYHRANAGGGR